MYIQKFFSESATQKNTENTFYQKPCRSLFSIQVIFVSQLISTFLFTLYLASVNFWIEWHRYKKQTKPIIAHSWHRVLSSRISWRPPFILVTPLFFQSCPTFSSSASASQSLADCVIVLHNVLIYLVNGIFLVIMDINLSSLKCAFALKCQVHLKFHTDDKEFAFTLIWRHT